MSNSEFASDIGERTFFGWDDDRNDLTMRVARRLGALDFGTHDQSIEPSEAVTEALVERIVDSKLSALSWTEGARNLRARAALVCEHRPEVTDKRVDDAALIESATEIFAPWLDRATGRKDIESIDMYNLLKTMLGWDVVKTVDELAPTHFELPGGRRVGIDYLAESPRISVRAQDAYGIPETPTLLGGAIPLTFELLSPARRPIQITSDLGAFWVGSWSEVRKDMAGRYPKHDWPADPSATRG